MSSPDPKAELQENIREAIMEYNVGIAAYLAHHLGYPEEEIFMLINEYNFNNYKEKL